MFRQPVLVLCILLSVAPLRAQQVGVPVQVNNAEVFALADEARDRSDFSLAEQLYRALATHEAGDLRREALFRLALMLADRQRRYRDAAILLRQILDEAPNSARVRVELARMQAQLGNLREAERELRAAQAIGLPPAVEQLVRFYAQALTATRPLGGSLQLAIAPDSNINRATRSGTLETVIGEFDLDEDARETSGVGLSLQGQAFARGGIDRHADLLVRVSASGDFYRQSEFDDWVVALQAGPQYRLGRGQLDFAVTAAHRWFGQKPFSLTLGTSAEYRLPLSPKSQLRATVALADAKYRFNEIQDGTYLTTRIGIDAAFSARIGGGINLSGARLGARDPGYATSSGGVDAYLYREFGPTTVVLDLGYGHLEADKRLLLYPRRRIDDRFNGRVSATFRSLRVGSFAPLLRLSYERNKSTVGIYDFDRKSAEAGITAAF